MQLFQADGQGVDGRARAVGEQFGHVAQVGVERVGTQATLEEEVGAETGEQLRVIQGGVLTFDADKVGDCLVFSD